MPLDQLSRPIAIRGQRGLRIEKLVRANGGDDLAVAEALGSLGYADDREVGVYERTEKAESFVPPQAVRAAAKRGLELRRKYGRGGLPTREAGQQGIGSGVARASTLASGKGVSLETVKRMKAFFARHQGNKASKTDDGKPGNGRTPGRRPTRRRRFP